MHAERDDQESQQESSSEWEEQGTASSLAPQHSAVPSEVPLRRGIVVATSAPAEVIGISSRVFAGAVNAGVASGSLVGSSVDYVASLEYRLASLRKSGTNPASCAGEVLALLRHLMLRETGTPHFEDALPVFFRRLNAEAPIRALLSDLIREASAAQTKGKAGSRFASTGTVSEELQYVIGWYLRRRSNQQALFDQALGNELEECLFNVRVSHDRTWAGEAGMEVSCGLRLLGRAGQPLWLKLMVRSEGRPVAPRAGYDSWTDETDSVLVPREEAAERVVAILPLTPNLQRQVIDRAVLFLPYGALQLPSGTREIELELGLFDEHGFPVFEASQLEMVSISRARGKASDSAGERAAELLPSPQRLGVWSSDPVSGSGISAIKARLLQQPIGAEAQRAVLSRVVRVSFDATVLGRADERLSIECRALTADGASISATSEALRGAQGSFLYRHELELVRPVEFLHEVLLEFPLSALDLPPGEQQIFLEVAIFDAAGRVIIGAVEPLKVNAESSSAAPADRALMVAAAPLSGGIAEQLSGVSVTQIILEPKALRLEAKAELRSESLIRDERGTRSWLWVRTILATLDGAELVSSAGIVFPASPDGAFHFVGCFDEAMILRRLGGSATLGGPANSAQVTSTPAGNQTVQTTQSSPVAPHEEPRSVVGPLRLLARTEVWSSEHVRVASKESPVSVNLRGPVAQGLPAELAGLEEGDVLADPHEIRVIDVVPGEMLLRSDIAVTLAVPSSERGRAPTLYLELLGADGEPLSDRPAPLGQLESSEGEAQLNGKIARIALPECWHELPRNALAQVGVRIPVELRERVRAHTLKISLFDGMGRLKQQQKLALRESRGSAPKKPLPEEPSSKSLSLVERLTARFAGR